MPGYLHFLDGGYSTAPGLTAMGKVAPEEQFVFQIDEQYDDFIENKRRCRRERLNKYYLEEKFYPETAAAVNRLLVHRLGVEYPGQFRPQGPCVLHNKRTGEMIRWGDDWINVQDGRYTSLFDALCSQVPEDIAVCQLERTSDWLAAIHLSSPNHWAAGDKIGKPFGEVHGPVPGMEKLNQHYFKMLDTAVRKGPFIRFAWGIATDKRLNHHPDAPPGTDPGYWQGRRVGDSNEPIYLRVERQVIVGLPECDAFVFTIRTYFYGIDDLASDEKKALLSAVENMSPQSLAYKGLTGALDSLLRRLQ
jgi:dimethylamine monooxygenase subunit A